jgi:hypothetical protein
METLQISTTISSLSTKKVINLLDGNLVALKILLKESNQHS